jgi:hypothetical protein
MNCEEEHVCYMRDPFITCECGDEEITTLWHNEWAAETAEDGMTQQSYNRTGGPSRRLQNVTGPTLRTTLPVVYQWNILKFCSNDWVTFDSTYASEYMWFDGWDVTKGAFTFKQNCGWEGKLYFGRDDFSPLILSVRLKIARSGTMSVFGKLGDVETYSIGEGFTVTKSKLGYTFTKKILDGLGSTSMSLICGRTSENQV